MNDPETVDFERDQRFANLLAKLMDDAGAQKELDLEATCREHPEFAEELRDIWGTLQVTQAAGNLSSKLDGESSRPKHQQLDLPLDIGGYVLEEEVGRGGMGIVYRARRTTDNQSVAVKMILAGNFAAPIERQRFLGEAEASANLNHSNIAPVINIGEYNGMPFYTMRLIEGQTLSQRLAAGPLPTRRAAAMMIKVCDAIQYAHDQGVLHRDIKPSNILIDEDGEPFVVDFGLAKKKSDQQSLTNTGAVIGTPSYMSPEQASGARAQISFNADIYSLGAVLYHMVTGRPPFLGERPVDTVLMVLEQDPITPRALNPRIHRDLEGIVLRCLQKPIDLRYPTASSISEDLNAFLQGQPVSARDGRLFQVFNNLMRETHHAPVLENWGLLWMWHSLVLLLASTITHFAYLAGQTDGTVYVTVWTGKFLTWAVVFWWLRRRMGPVTFVERQIAHVWAASLCLVIFIYPFEHMAGLEPLKLAPFLAIAAGTTFLIKAGILSGRFYLHSIALFACAIAMTIYPQYAMIMFGITSALCFFLPGLKYYRRRRKNLESVI